MVRSAGVDIGSNSIKIIEIENKKGILNLINSSISYIENKDVKTALSKMLASLNLSVNRVNVSLSGTSVIVRYIKMPPMSGTEFRSALEFEAEKYIPFDIKESIIDFAMLDKVSTTSQMVLLAVAKKQVVEGLISLFREAGLEINTVDIDSFALLNCFQKQGASSRKIEGTYGIINLGAKFSNMNIVDNGNVYFSRDILWGGMGITDRIEAALRITKESAENLKIMPGEKKEEMVKIINPVLEKLTSQITMSFDYFESEFGKAVSKLYISGGTAYLFNIFDFLKDSLGIEVLMWDPFEGITVNSAEKIVKEAPAVFAIAVGLSLRG